MATRTAQRIITRVMRGLGYLGKLADPKANESTDALDTFNDWIESLNIDNLILPYTLITDKVLTNAVSLYTVGPTGMIAIPRPEKIDNCSLVLGISPSTMELPMHRVIDASEWQRIVAKEMQTTQPGEYWYNPKSTLGELNINPVPSGTPTIRLYTQDRLTHIASLTTVLTFDDGIARMIHYNLGMELQPELGVPLPVKWEDRAKESKALVQSKHILDSKLELDHVIGIGGHYNVYSDRANRR